MSAEIAVIPQQVDTMLSRAIEKGLDADSLTKLVELQERVMAKQAEMDFNRAMLDFQSACPPISKSRTVNTGKYSYTYAELDHIATVIAPLLKQHGLSYSFNAEFGDGRVVATCKVRHVNGHSETSQFAAPIDKQASMNDAQKTASALSYARRYALIMALGLTTGETDDDGRSAGTQFITEEQTATLKALAEDVGADIPKFLAYMKADSIATIPAAHYSRAVKALEAKRRQA